MGVGLGEDGRVGGGAAVVVVEGEERGAASIEVVMGRE